MSSFKDTAGKSWTIHLDAPTIRAVRNALDLDLVDPDGKTYQRLADDPCLLVDCLWLLCQEQAGREGVKEEQFGKSLVGDAIEQATAALLAAIVDFSPTRRRELIQAVTAKNAKLRDIGTQRALAKINDETLEADILKAMEAEMDDAIRRALTRSRPVTASPVSAESAPAA